MAKFRGFPCFELLGGACKRREVNGDNGRVPREERLKRARAFPLSVVGKLRLI